jgi:DNA-binding NtrC family response regulator
LNVLGIHLPPLRERKNDLPVLAAAILGHLCRKAERKPLRLHPDALAFLVSHTWPGNARELRNVLEWTLITAGKAAGNDLILRCHLPRNLGKAEAPTPLHRKNGASACQFEVGRTLDQVEREYIDATLALTNNDRKKAARLLGISSRTLYNRLADSKTHNAS